MEIALLLSLLLLGLPVLALLYTILQFNGLVRLRNHIREAWSNVDTELKRRYDLIPRLVETVRGYARHEQQVLERVVELRDQSAAIHGTTGQQASSENRLVDGMRELLAVVENYPALKADQHFLKLQQELVNTEDRIQAARRFFNGNVRDYKNRREMFPSSIVAAAFSFGPEEFFEVHPAVKNVPDVNF